MLLTHRQTNKLGQKNNLLGGGNQSQNILEHVSHNRADTEQMMAAFSPGLLDRDDQVRYMTYMLTKDDCSKPDLMLAAISNIQKLSLTLLKSRLNSTYSEQIRYSDLI